MWVVPNVIVQILHIYINWMDKAYWCIYEKYVKIYKTKKRQKKWNLQMKWKKLNIVQFHKMVYGYVI